MKTLRFTTGECWLGLLLVAASDKGICAILMGDDASALTRDLQRRFPTANLLDGGQSFQPIVAEAVAVVTDPSLVLKTPLDLHGTAFQLRVWDALRSIPTGSTVSYTEIAQRIDRPQSVRAVGQATGANPVAVVIPCHRVVRRDGSLSGYRWGVERKSQLLHRERQPLSARQLITA